MIGMPNEVKEYVDDLYNKHSEQGQLYSENDFDEFKNALKCSGCYLSDEEYEEAFDYYFYGDTYQE